MNDEPRIIEELPDGGFVVELPDDVKGWLERNAGYARVRLGETEGALLVLPEIPEHPKLGGPMFGWQSDNGMGGIRSDLLPWAEAVKRFGPPVMIG